MKKFISLTLATLLTVGFMATALTACGNDKADTTTTQAETTTEATTKADVNVEQMAKDIIAKSIPVEIVPLEADVLEGIYNLDLTKVESYSVSMPMMNVKCDELAIIKVKDVADMETIKATLQTRYDAILANWQMYLPEQYDIAKEGQIVVNGNYIMLVVTEKVDEVVTTFNEMLNN